MKKNTMNGAGEEKGVHGEVPGYIDKMSTTMGLNRGDLINAWNDDEESGVVKYLMVHNFPKIYLNRCLEMMGLSVEQIGSDGTVKKI